MRPHLPLDDDSQDLREHYRGGSTQPEPTRRVHGTWHPGWGIAASVTVAFGLLVLTDYSELASAASPDEDMPDSTLMAPDESLIQPPEIGSYTAAPPPALPQTLRPPAGPDSTSRIEYIRQLLMAGQGDAAREQVLTLQHDAPTLELPPDLHHLLPPAQP